VQRRQLGQAQAALQARQQGVAGIAAHRRHRQEVRLVHHHQALVQVQQLLGEGDVHLASHLAPVPDPLARPVGRVHGQGGPALVQHLAGGQAGLPLRLVQHRQAPGQEGAQPGPALVMGQGHAAGRHTVAGRRPPGRAGTGHGA
jgi:hypothetical protein